jgi:Cu/Ag efflux protein CusF
MKIAQITMAGVAALITIQSAAFAQQAQTGTVTKIDRLSGTLTVQQTPTGTVGAGAGTAAEEFKVQDAAMLEAVHAGDKVSFSVSGAEGAKTITKLEKPKP